METLIERIARGNVAEVKVVLASVVMALAAYQLALIAIGYGKLRPPFLTAGPAARTHRAVGDAILVLVVVVALMCLSYFGLEDEGALHAATGAALLAVLAVKVAVIRWWHGASRLLPLLGGAAFLLLAATWLSSAGDFLAEGP